MDVRFKCPICGHSCLEDDKYLPTSIICGRCNHSFSPPNSGNVTPTSVPDRFSKCPFCAEEIRPDAIKCKHCGEFIKPPTARPQSDPLVLTQPLKNPGVAAVLSFFIPGLGQIYNGQILTGIIIIPVLICLWAALWFFGFGLLGFIFYIMVIHDAYSQAKKINVKMTSSLI